MTYKDSTLDFLFLSKKRFLQNLSSQIPSCGLSSGLAYLQVFMYGRFRVVGVEIDNF